MEFRIATFNCRDFFDDAVPHVIGQLDREGFGIWAQRRARALFHRKLEAIATMVARADADIIAFQEIEGAHVLDALRSTLGDGRYLPAVSGVADNRGIACGLLSRFPIASVETHGAGELAFPVFAEGDPRPFGARIQAKRGVLEATVTLPDQSALALMVVHMKSPRPVPRVDAGGESTGETGHYAAAEGAARATVMRLAEALYLRSRVDARLMREPQAQLAVLGDFNDGPEAAVVRAVVGDLAEMPRGRHADLELTASLERGILQHCVRAVPPGQRHTILYRGVGQQVDHILVSRGLWRRFRGARVLNEALRDGVGEGREDVESDHAPIVATFS